MDGALLFFSTAVVSSLVVDFYCFSMKHLSGNSPLNSPLVIICFLGFPFLIIAASILLFVSLHMIDIIQNPEIKINKPIVNILDWVIIFCTLIYAFFIKLITFKLASENNN
ncbi:MAG: hypothetical protein ACXV8Q_02975 [Methylobacter sp.]